MRPSKIDTPVERSVTSVWPRRSCSAREGGAGAVHALRHVSEATHTVCACTRALGPAHPRAHATPFACCRGLHARGRPGVRVRDRTRSLTSGMSFCEPASRSTHVSVVGGRPCTPRDAAKRTANVGIVRPSTSSSTGRSRNSSAKWACCGVSQPPSQLPRPTAAQPPLSRLPSARTRAAAAVAASPTLGSPWPAVSPGGAGAASGRGTLPLGTEGVEAGGTPPCAHAPIGRSMAHPTAAAAQPAPAARGAGGGICMPALDRAPGGARVASGDSNVGACAKARFAAAIATWRPATGASRCAAPCGAAPAAARTAPRISSRNSARICNAGGAVMGA